MPGCTFIMNCQNILHEIKIQNDGADVMAARATLLVAYTVHPYQCINRCINVSVDDVYYLRLMVLHVRGATSFTDLRTVNARPSL